MKRRMGVIAVVLGASALLVVMLSASGSAQSPGGRTIKLFESEKGGTFGYVDNPPKSKTRRSSTGDLLAFGNPILDEAKKQRLGLMSVQCAVTRPGTERTATVVCHGTAALRDGQIALEGVVRGNPKTIVAAVTGGTGAYNGAKGTLTSTHVKGGSQNTITLLP